MINKKAIKLTVEYLREHYKGEFTEEFLTEAEEWAMNKILEEEKQ